ENVRGLISWDNGVVLEQVCSDLEAEGYAVQTFVLPAASVGAPHRRDRVFIVAHSESTRGERQSIRTYAEAAEFAGIGCNALITDTSGTGRKELHFTTEPERGTQCRATSCGLRQIPCF
ncbi:MAG: hypothetical protein EBX40_00665, partial [Gammaproteobacteria bacterium]|nr:hypothetical protein [Gammaproteobacteria bacterium]